MARTSCPNRDLLRACLQGNVLEDPIMESVLDHVEECPECEALAQILDENDDLRAQLIGPVPVEATCNPEMKMVLGRLKRLVPSSAEAQALGSEATPISHLEGVANSTGEATPVPPFCDRTGPRDPAGLATTAPLEPCLGQLGEYLLLQKLGQGGMGLVYKAMHNRLKRLVAVKVITPERVRDAQAIARFRQEVEAAGRLDHPNIVRAYDASEAGGTHFLVMEHVQGNDLGRVLRDRGPLPADLACMLICQAALGLQHAHDKGLVHRDMKPSNLMLTEDGQVKILDLGLARLNADVPKALRLTILGTVMGSLDYISPEQIDQPGAVDCRADIYSLGCTLYHLLAGRVPFPAASSQEKLLAHQLKDPESLARLRPDLSAKLMRVIGRMMAKKREQRFASAAAVAEALRHFCRPPAKPHRPWRWLGLGLIGLAAAVATVVLRLNTETPARQPHQVVSDWLADSNAPAALQKAMQATVAADAKAERGTWTGKSDQLVFALAARPAPKSPVAQPAFRLLVHTLAVKELLLMRSVLSIYDDLKLDESLLREAIARSFDKIQLKGTAKGLLHETDLRDGVYVAYVAAPADGVKAVLTRAPAKEAVMAAYQSLVHERTREEMKKRRWKEAILLWRHLQDRELATLEFHLDASRCLKELGHADNSLKLLTETFKHSRDKASSALLAELGNLAFELRQRQGDAADLLARCAYEAAFERLGK